MKMICLLAICLLSNAPAIKEEGTIPLPRCYTTCGEKNVPQVERGNNDVNLKDARRMFEITTKVGPSNVFMIYAKDIREALPATNKGFTSLSGVGNPMSAGHEKEKGKDIWVVGYIGSAGSSPPCWQMSSAKRNGKSITINYMDGDGSSASADVHPYLIWIPLGRLESGDYEIKLIDAGRKVTTISRTVTVED